MTEIHDDLLFELMRTLVLDHPDGPDMTDEEMTQDIRRDAWYIVLAREAYAAGAVSAEAAPEHDAPRAPKSRDFRPPASIWGRNAITVDDQDAGAVLP